MDRYLPVLVENRRNEGTEAENSRNDEIVADIFTTVAPEPVPDDSEGYILIPLIVLFGILFLSALVYLMARNRRRLEHIYAKRRLKSDERNVRDDAALLRGDELDDPTEYLLNGKLEIENRYDTYKTTNVGHDRAAGESC